MVRPILKQERVLIPEEVKVTLKSKVITVEGPRGTVIRSFRRCPIQIIQEKNKDGKVVAVVIRIWFAKSKPKSNLNTIKKHITNMITGVTRGFRYVMKYGYNIFSMKAVVEQEKKVLKIIKFMGDINVRKINALDGVTFAVS